MAGKVFRLKHISLLASLQLSSFRVLVGNYIVVTMVGDQTPAQNIILGNEI